jgi:polysaccharide export outer membrane protein
MNKAIWTALLVVAPVVCGGAAFQQGPPGDNGRKPPETAAPELQGPPPAASVKPEAGKSPDASSPNAKSSGPAADPSKMDAPAAASGTNPKRAGGARVDDKSYVIGAEDQIGVNVWGVAALSSTYLVRPDGKITMPLIGDLEAAGLTPAQLQASVAARLKEKYINSPDVTILVLAVNSKKYYIHGEVNNPGAFPLIVPTTVLEALANAHGFKDFANVKKIRILRGTEQLKFNYKDVVHGRHSEQNIYLQPGDQIIVP